MAETSQIRFQDEQRLARHILGLCLDRPRTLIGIAGVPGSGKSTLARHLRDALGHIAQRPDVAIVVPMDGFHLTNAELNQRGLMDRKGSPDTYRTQSLYVKLLEIKRGSRPVLMPIYSREIHEPVPDAVEVKAETPLVIVEGNYLFCDFGMWRPISTVFDLKIFVETTPDKAKERVIARHIQGGMNAEAAAGKFDHNDAPNSELVAPAKSNADIMFG